MGQISSVRQGGNGTSQSPPTARMPSLSVPDSTWTEAAHGNQQRPPHHVHPQDDRAVSKVLNLTYFPLPDSARCVNRRYATHSLGL